jgi:hypothetical protein
MGLPSAESQAAIGPQWTIQELLRGNVLRRWSPTGRRPAGGAWLIGRELSGVLVVALRGEMIQAGFCRRTLPAWTSLRRSPTLTHELRSTK